MRFKLESKSGPTAMKAQAAPGRRRQPWHQSSDSPAVSRTTTKHTRWNFGELGWRLGIKRDKMKDQAVLHWNGPKKPWMKEGLSAAAGCPCLQRVICAVSVVSPKACSPRFVFACNAFLHGLRLLIVLRNAIRHRDIGDFISKEISETLFNP